MNGWKRIVGHEWAVSLFQGALATGRIGHAYLLTGPDQVGKATLARTFAQALNCELEEAALRPCGRCRTCRLIEADRHPDVHVLSGELSSRGKVSIKIDQIRELQRALNLTAAEARWKVAILRQFETANINAANAFLKMLEEPPRNVVLILTATDADSLLPTIPSRCQVINLRPLTAAVIETVLKERWQVPADKARLLAHLADGRLGWAIRTAQDETILETRERWLSALFEALSQKRVGRFKLAERLAARPERLPAVLRAWLSLWRDLVLWQQAADGDQMLVNVDRMAEFKRVAETWPAEVAIVGLKRTQTALWQLDHNANTRLVLENLLLAYPYPETVREPQGD